MPRIGLKGFDSFADTGRMENQRSRSGSTCDEVRSTRLHYQLRCLLGSDHDGEHRWTPELVPGLDDEAAAG